MKPVKNKNGARYRQLLRFEARSWKRPNVGHSIFGESTRIIIFTVSLVDDLNSHKKDH